jgi:C4-dicarboxylate-specific signal transduction histidine kinase
MMGAMPAASICAAKPAGAPAAARFMSEHLKAPSRQEALAINQAILEVIALLHGELVEHGVLVQTQLAEDLPILQGDRVQLQQVILNLIINAVQAMSSVSEGPRELLISTGRAEPDSVFVAVRDTGPGLAPAVLERLFEPFYTTKPSGLGLGLLNCGPAL